MDTSQSKSSFENTLRSEKRLTYTQFYELASEAGVRGESLKFLEPHRTGNYNGSYYDAYKAWYILENSPLGRALA